MQLAAAFPVGLALALAAACGGKSEQSGAGGAGGSGGSSASGGSGGSGASSGSGGSGGSSPSCEALETEYASTLGQAKICNALINAIQCTELVDTELACPCRTYVNPAHAVALAKLEQLKADWSAKHCMEGRACPEIGCVEPQGSACQPGAAPDDGDACVDFGPD